MLEVTSFKERTEKVWRTNVVRKSLVAFDTDHIKGYVFGTDRLKEIRGASALLDKLNRNVMLEIARSYCQQKKIKYEPIYLNGGSGLFLLMAGKEMAHEFGKLVQKRYQEDTDGGASVTYVVYELREDLPDDIKALKIENLSTEFEMVRYLLREAKGNPLSLDTITLATHPFFRACDSCGINYTEKRVITDPNDPDNEDDQGLYCSICLHKQQEDNNVKNWLTKANKKIKANTPSEFLEKQSIDAEHINDRNLWERILYYLNEEQYKFEFEEAKKFPKRPKDFNVFRDFSQGGKDYLGLIYADANNMGIRIETLDTLTKQEKFAKEVDRIIHVAMSKAIKQHLRVSQKGNEKLFPFDVLLLGGDDLVMVTHASKAMDVAYTIAKEFYELAKASKIIHPQDPKKDDLAEDPACTLSIGVVLAPIKYPFNLLRHMSEDALKAAKRESLKIRKQAIDKSKGGLVTQVNDSCINFVVVTGGSIKKFDDVDKNYKSTDDKNNDFHATLRPYDLENLELLLNAIKEGHKRNLGRTKLHALREAILEKNLTTSVSHSLAVLRNWREEQRKFAVASLYEFGGRAIPKTDIKDPTKGFPRITFPWFVDQTNGGNTKHEVYRTAFLDFIELFDFVTTDREEERA
jgi:hypothetical protein